MIDSKRVTFFVTVDWYFCHHYLDLACAVQAAGYRVSVITSVQDCGQRIRDQGIELIPFEISRKGMNPLKELMTVLRLTRVLRSQRPALLHNIAQKPILYGTLAARSSGVPAVVNAVAGMGYLFTSSDLKARLVRGLVGGAYRALMSASGVRLLVQNSDDQGQVLALTGVNPTLIPGSGVDTARIVPNRHRGGIVTVVLASRMLWDKGVGELVEAARMLKSRGVHARFVLVGKPDPGNPHSIPESRLRAWHDEGCIEWWGFRSDMPRVLDQAHVACLPSYYREGLPKFLIESAAAGLPLVTTDATGCREAVDDGINGLLVPPRDPEALAGALRRLIDDRALRDAFGRRSRTMAEERFSSDRIHAEVLRVYRDLLGGTIAEPSPPGLSR